MTLTLPASTYQLSGLYRLELSISRPIILELSRHSFSSLAFYKKMEIHWHSDQIFKLKSALYVEKITFYCQDWKKSKKKKGIKKRQIISRYLCRGK